MIVVEALTLQDYPWQIHKQIRDKGVPSEQAYVNSWKYIIWVLLGRKLLGRDQPARYKVFDRLFWQRIADANRRYLERFLKQNYGSAAPTFGELLVDRARQVRSLQVATVGVGADSSDPFDRLSRSINVMNREIQSRILAILAKRIRYFLVFDQLDLGWDSTEETMQLLIGLILAARDVVRAADSAGKEVHVVLFLRSDIYESLRFEDKNKLSPSVVELRWDPERLKQLVSRRIQASAGGTWEDIFTGDRMRQQVTQSSYIVRRTMLRPRDMIQFCVCAREAAVKSGKGRIDNDSIYAGERPYSNYMRHEIQDESKASGPMIDDLLGVLQEIRLDRITQDEFAAACEARGVRDPRSALRQLIDLSVLGVYRTGGRMGGSEIVFRYQAQPWEQLEPTARLAVHPSLKHALVLREPRKKEDSD